MSITVKLPALGESVVEGIVSQWLVREGDFVEVDQSLCEVTTDKVDAEIPAPAAGRVERILVSEGATVDVGAELMTIDVEASRTDAGEVPPRATPVARRVAQDADLDLAQVRGTGSAGCVTKTDVLSHSHVMSHVTSPAAEHIASYAVPAAPLTARSEEAPAEVGPERVTAQATPSLPQLQIELEEGDRVVPMSPQRRLIAAHMVYSKHTSPHVGTVAEVDLGGVAALRRTEAERFREQNGSALTMLPFVAYSVVRALREFPALNASVANEAIIERHGIHLAFAVETEKGLLAPVVRHADRLSLAGLALAIDDLSRRARERRLGPDELRGGTFTVSNPGRKGNLYGFAIINQPQVGILRMGELVKRPVVKSVGGEDAIVVRPMMHLALSYDHRAVDGARANAFLYAIRERLEAAEFEL